MKILSGKVWQLVVVMFLVVAQISPAMTSTIQISTEVCQTVLSEKINYAAANGLILMDAQQYDQALVMFHQVVDQAASLSNQEQREYVITNIIQDQRFAFLPLAKLPRQTQNQWVEWLKKVQQYALNLGVNASLTIAQNLEQVAQGYKILGRIDLAAIALKQATQAASQIPEPLNRANQFIQLASAWLRFQDKRETERVLAQAVVAVEQIPNEDPSISWSYLFSIASLYAKLSQPQRALSLATKIDNEYYQNTIRQEIVTDAIKRGDLQLAQTITKQIQGAEYQANALVDMAIYWATNNRHQQGDRLFAEALQLVAKDERSESLQSTLIQRYVASGQIAISFNAAQKLTQDEPKALALGEIALAYAKAKQPQKVQQVLAQLQGLIQSDAAINPVGYLGNILQGAVNAQQYDLAMTIVNAVENNIDFFAKQHWYQQIVQAPLRSQNFDKALQLAKQIPNNPWVEERNTRLQEIAIAYAQAKKWRQATELITQIENTINTPYQIITRAELAAIAPTSQQFTTLILPAVAQTQALEQIAQKALAQVAIAQAYQRSGNTKIAQAYLQQAIQTTQKTEYDDMRGHLLMQLTNYLLEQRQYAAAVPLAQVNPVSHLQQSSYSSIFQAALDSFDFDVALQVANSESLPDIQATKLLDIAQRYVQLQRPQDAIALLNRAFEVAQKIADPESRMIQVTEYTQVEDIYDRGHQYTRLVKLYVTLGQREQAQKVVDKIQGTSLRDDLQAWISC